MSVSLEKIAEMMKVSVSTVSRALSGMPGVSEAKKEKIIELANKLGYAPNVQASLLRTGKGRGLAILTRINPSEISAVRNSVLFRLGKKAFGSIRVIVLSENNELNGAIQQIVSEKYLAVIVSTHVEKISPENIELLKARKIPLTSIDADYEGFDSALINRENGTFQAARMLILSGCKNPVFYCNASKNNPDERLSGIMKAFKSLGKSTDEINLAPFAGTSSFEAGYKITNEVLKTRHVDGIFCYNDNLALGTLRALHKAGIRVPEEVKVIGFDNIPVSEHLPVSLTTVAQPVEELAEAALEMTLDKLENFDREARKIYLPAKLLVRESAPINSYDLREKIFETP
ncbi:MAG: hypothetical protein A2017_16175 [Lentisphaerae bacterium GWF2_44_16]|nr:MAG: hypothetical protein A2017_16175 [Lentisphaerae bacterium GWF2_44_16]